MSISRCDVRVSSRSREFAAAAVIQAHHGGILGWRQLACSLHNDKCRVEQDRDWIKATSAIEKSQSSITW